ncbi:MAG: DUF305 domain-containing protein [Candidatus Microsaccharimonas sp.]
MNKNIIIALAIGLVVGVGGTAGVVALTKDGDTANTDSTTVTDHSTMSMADMNEELTSKTGDDFDKAFLEMMIAHHQGAIDMANLASTRAEHEEIKTLSQAIITAQNKEISDMQQWQMGWSYVTDDDSMPGMSH